jgi:hypothetical protein
MLGIFGDLWTLDVVNFVWTLVTAAGTPPGTTTDHNGERFIAFSHLFVSILPNKSNCKPTKSTSFHYR